MWIVSELLHTGHGEARLPVFLPDATRAVVRALDCSDLEAAGVEALCANAFHLSARPGAAAIGTVGGIHRFMGWHGPIFTDSGGFQLYSLLAQSSRMGSVSKRGFHHRPEKGGRKRLFTPEKSIRQQHRMGADVLVCLDHFVPAEAPREQQRECVEHTILWAERCRREFDRLVAQRPDRPMLFAVVQGGDDTALRAECARRLTEIGFDGYGFGGGPVHGDGSLREAVHLVAEQTPPDKPKWAFGIGKPEHVVAAAGFGYDIFDCVIPTRDARHLRLYLFRDEPRRLSLAGGGFYDRIYIHDGKYARDDSPIDSRCDCLCCRRYSRAYLHHMFHIRDALAYRLATIHNLRFYMRLMALLRARAPAEPSGPERP
jgi:queuine tRNA-ribosyltransferase